MSNGERAAGPGPKYKLMLRTWKRDFWIAAAVYVFFEGGAWLSTHRLPPGDVFVLEPHGWAAVKEFAQSVGLLTFFYIFATASAFVVRRSLGCALKTMMFFVLVGGLAYVQGEQFIAAVRQPSDFVFVRRFPFGSHTVPFRHLRYVLVRNSEPDTVRTLSLTDDPGHGRRYEITCRPVWTSDERARRALDRLVESLRAAEFQPDPPPALPATTQTKPD